MTGAFPVDLILFAMVAAFLVLRLRSVLGRRTGFERPAQPEQRAGGVDVRARPTIEGVAEDVAAAAGRSRRVVPDARTAAGKALVQIAGIDPGFEPTGFLDGAEAAFRMIIAAFAAGDRATLRPLLAEDTYAGFEQAITRREQAGERQRTELRAVHELAIEAADLRGTIADVTVRLVTDQVNLTLGRDGEAVTGSDAVTELTDIWTFQRDLTAADPTWKLVATRSA